MKIIEFIIILILSLINKSGVYFSDFDYTVCTTPSSCIHEQGHVLDDSLNFPSQTEEFKNTVDKEFPLLLEDTSCVFETESCLYTEAYARLWGVLDGDIDKMKKHFREFIEFYKE